MRLPHLIRLYPGQARTFEFDEPVDRIVAAVNGIADILPHTDRTFTFQALTPGRVLTEAFAKDGHLIYRMMIVVDGGNLVRVQRWPDTGESNSYLCTDIGGCDSAGSDASVQVREPERNGGSVQTTP